MRKLRRYYAAPELPSQALYLNPHGPGFFSIVVPIARTNEVTNPSIETATTNYTAVGGSIAQSSTQSYHGAYSLAITPTAALTDGAFYGTISTTAGQVRAVSCKWRGAAGVKYKLSVATTAGVDLVAKRFIATGRWQWVWVYWVETSTTTRRIYFTKDSHTSTAVFYIDGVQSEVINAGETVSTYIDGDQAGLLPNQFPYPYRWNGTPHASTSTRDVTTRAGGYVMNLDRFRFRLLGYVGLGVTLVANIANVGAAADGAAFQTTIANSRQIAVKGRFEASTPEQLDRLRSDLYTIVGPDSATPRQPMTLIYQRFNGETEVGDFGRIIASYQSGLEQNASALPVEEATVTFTQYLPAILTGESGTALTVQSSVTNANGILQRSPAGVWSALGTGTNVGGVVRTILYAVDGSLYAGGLFTSMGGVANTVSIARYTNGAWTALGTGVTLGTEVREIVQGPDGNIYAVGTFTDAGGVANTARIAKWNGSAWSSITPTVANNSVSAATFGPDGSLYVGGNFTAVNGVAANFVAKYDGTTWTALGAGPGANCTALAFDTAGNLYAAGTYIKKWDGSAWTDLDGTAANVQETSVGPGGLVYAGGNFSSIGGISANGVARYAGGWLPLGPGMTPAGTIRRVATDPITGQVFIGGESFTTAGNVTLPDPVARWNGAAWTLIGVDLPSFPAVHAVAFASDGTLTLGYSTTGTATVEGITTVANNGTARAYPDIVITGPSSGSARIYHLLNITTGKFTFLNLTISTGERITLRTSPSGTTFTSSSRGPIPDAILPGSASDLSLIRGNNTISFFANSSTVTALMRWSNAFQSASDLTP